MKNYIKIFMLSIFIAGLQQTLVANSSDTLRFEYLITKPLLEKAEVKGTLISSMDVTRNHLILLSNGNDFYVLGWGGIQQIGRPSSHISSFAVNREGFVVAARKKELCYVDSTGSLSKLFDIPHANMGVSAGDSLLYIYDRTPYKKCGLYVITERGLYTKLIDAPAPFADVIEANNKILFASKSALFSYNPVDKKVKSLASLVKGNNIVSIAYDNQRKLIFFSTNKAIYYIKNNKIYSLTDKCGGVLKFFEKGLIIFNPENKTVIRIVGLNSLL